MLSRLVGAAEILCRQTNSLGGLIIYFPARPVAEPSLTCSTLRQQSQSGLRVPNMSNDLEKRISTLEADLAERKRDEEERREIARRREFVNACARRGHQWRADDNLGRFYTCVVCGSLWNAWRRGEPI